MFGLFNSEKKELYRKMLNQCGLLLHAYAFYKVLDSGMARKGVDPSIQTSFWGLDFREASRVFFNTAILHAKVLALEDQSAKQHVEGTLDMDIYPRMKAAFQEGDKREDQEFNFLMTCHFLYPLWLENIKAVGEQGFKTMYKETEGEAVPLSKRLLAEVPPPFDVFQANHSKNDYMKYAMYVERYFLLWIEEGFFERTEDQQLPQIKKTEKKKIFLKPKPKNKPPDFGNSKDGSPGIL